MGNFESNMNNVLDNDPESDSSSEDIEIGYDMLNLYLDYNDGESDSSHNDSNDDLLNLLLQRFINTWVHKGIINQRLEE